MPSRIVQSQQNSRLKMLRRALSAPGRDAGAPAGIEGPNLLAEAVRAGLRIPTVFAALGSERLLDGLKLRPETEVLLVPREILTSALTTETPQPIAALVEPREWIWRDLFEGFDRPATPLIAVLAGLQDPGNLGTILRSAEAFGATGVVSLPGTVSAWNPKAVRASAGSVFRLPLLTVSREECFSNLREAGVTIFATLSRAAQPLGRIDFAGPVALLIGNEGNGLSKELAAEADSNVTISCPGPVESLNAAVAASVLLYEASRQRLVRQVEPGEQRRGARR